MSDAVDQATALLDVVVDESSVSDEIVGFHAQQAVEKSLKAVLCIHGMVYRRTHDIAELLDALTDGGCELPAAMQSAAELTPFAVELRYESLSDEVDVAESFDRQRARSVARSVYAWACGRLPDVSSGGV